MSKLLAMMMNKKMPSRYQEVEYIESTGTQYIDTGIEKDLTHTYRIKGRISWNDVTNRQLFGMQGYVYFGVLNGFYQIAQGGTTVTPVSATIGNIDTFDIVFDIPNNMCSYNVNNISDSYICVYGTTYNNFYLFNLSNLSFDCKCKLYNFQLFDNSILVRNFIPVYDTITQKYGMWESVQGKFYGNDGTGDFKGSIVGYTVVGSPTITDGVVSGFSLVNYLQIPTDFNNNDFEILLKIEDVGTNLLARTIMRLQNADVTIGLTASNALSLIGISGLYFDSGFNTNGILYVKFIQKGLNCSLGYSNDGITYTMLNITLTEAISYVSPNRLMQSSNWSNISVKLHIKDCLIKINNKLWFNGQPA